MFGQQTLEPLRVVDDEEFTKQEILGVLEKFDSIKVPGEDGMNSDISTAADLQVLS